MAAIATQASVRRGMGEQCSTDYKSVQDTLRHGKSQATKGGTTHALILTSLLDARSAGTLALR